MPADIIVPGRAAAWSNTPPNTIPQSQIVDALCRTTANLTTFNSTTSSIDGVTLQGLQSTASSRLVLVGSQTTKSQNGLYIAGNNGNVVSLTGSFSAGGTLVKSGLTVGRLYYWGKGNGTQITNGTVTLTASGFIASDGSGNVTITGPASTPISDIMVEASLDRSTSFDSAEEFNDLTVRVNQGSGTKPEWWRQSATVVTVGTSTIQFDQLTTAATITPGRAAGYDKTAGSIITPGRAAAWDNTPAVIIP